MTCASCVARVEKRLNAIDGVRATVNLPLASAHVDYDGAADPAELSCSSGRRRGDHRLSRAAGWTAGSVAPQPVSPVDAPPAHHDAGEHARRSRRTRPWVADRGRHPQAARPAAPAAGLGAARRPGRGRLDDQRPAVPAVATCPACSSPCRSSAGAPGRSTGPPRSTRGTAPRRWTPWSRSASSRRPSRRCGPRSPAATAISRSPSPCRSSCWPAGTPRPGPTHSGAAALRALLDLGAKDVALLDRPRRTVATVERRVPISSSGRDRVRGPAGGEGRDRRRRR